MSEVDKPYVVWNDCGYEGWDPEGFDSLKEALFAIASYGRGHKKVLTRRMVLDAHDAVAEEAKNYSPAKENPDV